MSPLKVEFTPGDRSGNQRNSKCEKDLRKDCLLEDGGVHMARNTSHQGNGNLSPIKSQGTKIYQQPE